MLRLGFSSSGSRITLLRVEDLLFVLMLLRFSDKWLWLWFEFRAEAQLQIQLRVEVYVFQIYLRLVLCSYELGKVRLDFLH